MGEWTLSDIQADLILIVSIITSIAFLGAKIKTWIGKDVLKVDMQQTKNFLVRAFADIEREVPLTEIEKLRLKEQYDHYINHGGNSYIKDEYEKLKKDGKL